MIGSAYGLRETATAFLAVCALCVLTICAISTVQVIWWAVRVVAPEEWRRFRKWCSRRRKRCK